jgi:putative ABC transport system permease protein
MSLLRNIATGLHYLFRKEEVDHELDEELGAYLEMAAAEKMKEGMTRKEAVRAVRLEKGNVEIARETIRSATWESGLETCWQDLRFAGRMLKKNLGFTSVAVLVMALGIGANAAMFSVVNAVLLRPLSFNDPERIVTLASLWKKSGDHGPVSAPDFRDWHEQSTAFEAMAYYQGREEAVTAGFVAEYAQEVMVSREFFRVFNVRAAIGREFTADEVKPGSTGVAMISTDFAVSHYGNPNKALGQKIRMFDRTLDVVGVLPPGFHFPIKSSIWFPANTIFRDNEFRSGHNYRVVGKLKAGVTLEQAQAQMTAIGSRLEKQYPDSNADKSVAVTRMRDDMVGTFRITLWVMLAAVAVVLLIACGNLASMLLAKALGRSREIAVRAALGAGRGRIARQLITESLVLALLSGAFGVLLAFWGARALVALAPSDVPRLLETSVDARVLVFTLIVSVVASLLFGLAPALQVWQVDLNKSLKQGTTRTASGNITGLFRGGLVVTEIALSMMLLITAGLLLKSFVALQNVSLGFRPERVLVMETSFSASDLASAKRATVFYKDLLAEIAAIPGVLNSSAVMELPVRIMSAGNYFTDRHTDISQFHVNTPSAVYSIVAPGAFATLGVPLIEGRDFNDRDTLDAPFSAIINQKLAAEAFPGQDPIGHLINWGMDSPEPMKIVGVVGNVRQAGPASSPQSEIFAPFQQHPGPSTALNILVRTALEPNALFPTLQQMVQALSPDVPVKFTTMEASVSDNVAAPRFRTLLLGVFAALAVILAMAGVYGLMSYVAGQRSNEIGLRMALGASPSDVLRLILGQGLALTTAGIVLGLLCAAGVTRLLQSMLFEVKATDPLTYFVVITALAGVALAASYIPARRAMRVDPMVALRYE